jgi:hypothetical protein
MFWFARLSPAALSHMAPLGLVRLPASDMNFDLRAPQFARDHKHQRLLSCRLTIALPNAVDGE